MSKYKILGAVNILLGIFFGYILATSYYGHEFSYTLSSFILDYLLIFILGTFILINLFVVYKIFVQHELQEFKKYLILTVATVFWFLFFFLGYFVAASVLLPIVSVVTVAVILYFLRSNKKLAIFLSIITLLLSVATIFSGFEEDYCVSKGIDANPNNSKLVVATKQDAELLSNFQIREGSEIYLNFREHMLCHTSFKFEDAMKEKYRL